MAMAFVQWLGHQVFTYALGADGEGVVEDDEFVDLQCGQTLFHNVPTEMRTELWLSQLHHNPASLRAAHNYASYLRLVR